MHSANSCTTRFLTRCCVFRKTYYSVLLRLLALISLCNFCSFLCAISQGRVFSQGRGCTISSIHLHHLEICVPFSRQGSCTHHILVASPFVLWRRTRSIRQIYYPSALACCKMNCYNSCTFDLGIFPRSKLDNIVRTVSANPRHSCRAYLP